MDSIVGKTKKKNKAEAKTERYQIRVEVARPGGKKYTHLDWEDVLRSNGKEKDEESLRRFYNDDTWALHKKLGQLKTKSGKKVRVDLDNLFQMNMNAGYDMDDDFIDDSEAIDEENIPTKKGGFYVGKGDLKALDVEEEEEEESEEEEEVQKKPRKRKEKGGVAQESTSDSDDSEPVRMTGAPPMARMTGAPPTKKMLIRRPSPSTPTQRKEVSGEKKKHVEVSSTSSDDEPPAKKKTVEAIPAPAAPVLLATSSESSSSDIVVIEAPSAKPTVVTTKIVKKQDEMNKKQCPPSTSVAVAASRPTSGLSTTASATTTSSPSKDSPVKNADVAAIVTRKFTTLGLKGKEFQEKKSVVLDAAVIEEIREFLLLPKIHKFEQLKMESLTEAVAKLFGFSVEELQRKIAPVVHVKKEPSETSSEWKLSSADLPSMSDTDIANMTTIVNSWRGTKQLPYSVIIAWLKEINQGKLTADEARTKFYDRVRVLPDLDKPALPDTNQELPKHERSRKPRMFLHQWVYLSRKYVEMVLPTLKKPSTDGFAKKQVQAANALKEALRKQQSSFEHKKDKTSDAVYQFQFTEPVLAAIWTYLDEMCDYSLSIGKLEILVSALDSLHQALDNKVTLIQFYLEVCRRLQKLSFLTVEEPMKTRLAQAKEHIAKHQVVQNTKYMIKWPNGEEPSMRGLNRELHFAAYEKSVLANSKPHPAPAVVRMSASAPTSSPSTSSAKPTPTPLATRQPTDVERVAMNQIVEVNTHYRQLLQQHNQQRQ